MVKRPWLAALLNAWPMPLGVGYLYLRQWARFVMSLLLLQIIAATIVRLLFGSDVGNLFAAAVTIAVIVDAYLLAKRMNASLQAAAAVATPLKKPEEAGGARHLLREREPVESSEARSEAKCPSCGTQVALDDAFCRECGRALVQKTRLLPVTLLLTVGVGVPVVAALCLVVWNAAVRPPQPPPTPVAAVEAPSPSPSPNDTPTPSPSPTEAPTPASLIYIVVLGDTLGSIADRFDTTTQAIMELNGLTSTTIYRGTALHIPQSESMPPASGEHPDDAFAECCADVLLGFVDLVDAVATAGEAADTEVFCAAQEQWQDDVGELRIRHAACPVPDDVQLLAASDSLGVALVEMAEATRLFGEFCRSEDLHFADEANQLGRQALSHATEAYEALTGQSIPVPVADDVSLIWVDCVSDILIQLWGLLDDVESGTDTESMAAFCASLTDWASRLERLQADHTLCPIPTDPCLLATRTSFDKCLQELSAGYDHYGEACDRDDVTLLEEGTRHLLEGLAYAEETVDAVRQCGAD